MSSCNCCICAKEFNSDEQGTELKQINITSFKICQACYDLADPEDDYKSVKIILDKYLQYS